MKKVISLLAALVMVFAASAAFAEREPAAIYAKGLELDAAAVFIDDTAYFPVRAVCGALGINVDWDGENRRVIIGIPPTEFADGEGINVYVDGLKTDAAAVIIEGRTYVPAYVLKEETLLEYIMIGDDFTIRSGSYSSFADGEGYKQLTPAERKAIRKTRFAMAGGELKAAFPNEAGAHYEIAFGGYSPSYDVWRGEAKPVWRYTVSGEGHVWEIVSVTQSEELVEEIAEAVGRYPYSLRKNLKQFIYAPSSSTYNYHSSAGGFWWRSYNLTEDDAKFLTAGMLDAFVAYPFSAGEMGELMEWSDVCKADADQIDAQNFIWDLTAFGRLFFAAKENGASAAVEKLYPNRFKYYAAALYDTDREYFAEYKPYYDAVSADLSHDRLTANT